MSMTIECSFHDIRRAGISYQICSHTIEDAQGDTPDDPTRDYTSFLVLMFDPQGVGDLAMDLYNMDRGAPRCSSSARNWEVAKFLLRMGVSFHTC